MHAYVYRHTTHICILKVIIKIIIMIIIMIITQVTITVTAARPPLYCPVNYSSTAHEKMMCNFMSVNDVSHFGHFVCIIMECTQLCILVNYPYVSIWKMSFLELYKNLNLLCWSRIEMLRTTYTLWNQYKYAC